MNNTSTGTRRYSQIDNKYNWADYLRLMDAGMKLLPHNFMKKISFHNVLCKLI